MYEDHEDALKKKMYQRYDRIKAQNPKAIVNFDIETGLLYPLNKRIKELNPYDLFGTARVVIVCGCEKYNKIIDEESDTKAIKPDNVYYIDKLWDQFYNLNAMFTIGEKYRFTLTGISLKKDHMGNERLFKMSDFRILRQ